jgi:hypothetical protein
MKRRHPLLSLVAAASGLGLWLAGCGPQDLGHPWFPLRDGERQVYTVTTREHEDDTTPTVQAWTLHTEGPLEWDGRRWMTRHHSAGVRYWFLVDEAGIRRVATQADIDREPTPDPEPLWVLKAPLAVGQEWTSRTVPYLIQRRNEHPRELRYTHQAPMTWRIESMDETLTLADGSTVSPCLRLVGRATLNLYTDPVNGFTDVPLISREWYCQGKGLMKFEREEKVPPGFMTGGLLSAERRR